MTKSIEYITETLGTVTEILLGLVQRDKTPVNQDEIQSWLQSRLHNYTLLTGYGEWKGSQEAILSIRFTGKDADSAAVLAAELAVEFKQESVGLIREGIYTRVVPRRGRRPLDQLLLSRFKQYIDQGISFEQIPQELQSWWLSRY